MDVVSYAKSRSYTDETWAGGGIAAGKNCTIESTTPITGGTRITFLWTLDDGTEQRTTLDVMNGADGQDGEDGLSVESAAIDANNHLILTMTDSSEIDCGEVPTVKGDPGDPGEDGEDGFSPTIEVKTETSEEYVLTITDKEGSYDTPNLRGRANSIADLEDIIISSPQDGQTLVYNAAIQKWINQNGSADIESLGDIADVDLTSLQDGQVIKWDAANSKWVNADATNPTQFEVMPVAGDFPLAVIQFVGADTADYTRGYFYRSNPTVISGEVVYNWQRIDTQPNNNDYDNLSNHPEINSVELVGNKSLDDIGVNGKFQYTTMPIPSADLVSKIVQYIGTSTADYKTGYWYQDTYDVASGNYVWAELNVSGNTDFANRISSLETNQGDMSTLEIVGVSDLVSALNALNGKGLSTITYTEPNLVLTYADGTTITFNVRDSILRETQIGELANVTDSTVQNTNVLQYDSSILGYKPYDIVGALTALLQSAKDYTDQEIASAVQDDAYICDAKPACSYDSGQDKYIVVYYQNSVVHTTDDTNARFYYEDNGDPYCTSWFVTGDSSVDPVEFTYLISSPDFDDYVNKNTDITSTYTTDFADKSKVPNVAALDALLAIVNTALGLKVNTADIVDNLTTQDATKPLSANQGKVLNDAIAEKQDIMQYDTMPTASVDLLTKIVQYVGATSMSYKNGSFYRCVSDGESTPTYSWEEVEFAPDMIPMTTAEVDALWA